MKRREQMTLAINTEQHSPSSIQGKEIIQHSSLTPNETKQHPPTTPNKTLQHSHPILLCTATNNPRRSPHSSHATPISLFDCPLPSQFSSLAKGFDPTTFPQSLSSTKSLYRRILLPILVLVVNRILRIHWLRKIPLCGCCVWTERHHSPSGRSVGLFLSIHPRTADSFVGVLSFCSQWNGVPTRISCLGMYPFEPPFMQIPHRVVRLASCILIALACVCKKHDTNPQCRCSRKETPPPPSCTTGTLVSTDTCRTWVDCRKSAVQIPPAAD